MAGQVAQAAFRRFLSDLRREVIPAALLKHEDLARLDAERRRLVQALEDAEKSGVRFPSDEEYVAARTRALREERELPPPPPTAADLAAGNERRARDVQAASDALLALGDDICQAVRERPEYEQQAQSDVTTLRAEAEEMRRRAQEAERKATEAEVYVLWLSRVAEDELFVPTLP